MKKTILATLVALTAATAVSVGAAIPANAATATVAVTPSGPLARAATTVSVRVSNVPAGQGVYLMYCASPAAGARPTACFGRGVWASSDPKMTAQGAQPLDGALSLPVAIQFTPQGSAAVDCEKAGCGVFVRRDHMGPTDFSLDAFTPLAFVPLIEAKISTEVQAGRVLFTVQGFNGKTVDVEFGGRKLSRAISADSVKFYVGNTKQKSVAVKVSAGDAQSYEAKLQLKK